MDICIDGIIGCGKSSVLEALRSPDVTIVPEPLDEWGSVLEAFYNNPKGNALLLQLTVLHHFHNRKKNTSGVVLWERSPSASKNIFADMLHNSKTLSSMDYNAYCGFHEAMSWTPTCGIYIKCDPYTAYQRMTSRQYDCDRMVDMEYVESLHEQYETFIDKVYPLLHVVDGNQPLDAVVKDIKAILTSYSVSVDGTD